MPTKLIPHVDDASRLELMERLESNGRLSSDFLTLLAGATTIATLGLFQNSPGRYHWRNDYCAADETTCVPVTTSITADVKSPLQGSLYFLIIGTAMA
ncbi:MAG: hypothetical protein IPO31_23610 [Candidatus Obscuribacter sp.]|nr:hypothetical protein [Candidatus Obscuribacter sp.]